MSSQDSLPTALYRAEQARAFDQLAIEEHGIAGIELMNRAGAAAYEILRQSWPQAVQITVLVGAGNNGGDGYVLARLAQADGLQVRVLSLIDPERLQGDAASACAAYHAAGGAVERYQGLPEDADVFVDGLLGTGLERPLEGVWAEVVEALDRQSQPVLALDLPSGLQADTGRVLGAAVHATVTVTFVALKQGLFVGAGPDCCGEIFCASLGLPAGLLEQEPVSARRVRWGQFRDSLGPRPRTAHKGSFGHVVIIGGAPGMSGAARLAGEAALRAGAGLVTVATHPAHAMLANLLRPELMVAALDGPDDLVRLVERADIVAIGPGLGRRSWGRRLWEHVLDLSVPLVVDADALNLLAEAPQKGPDWVLTPHPGEAARLLGCSIAEIEQDRLASARELQKRYGGVVVLKGAGTVVQGAQSSLPSVCCNGNPGMATAGSGDVLTGVIAAMRAQNPEAEAAACCGVCLHAAAGDRAARNGERGLIASDIIRMLRPVANFVDGD